MDAYTRIAKPTSSVYTIISDPGKEKYDDPLYIYDDSRLSYDGGDGSTYTNIPKPVSSVYTKIVKPTT